MARSWNEFGITTDSLERAGVHRPQPRTVHAGLGTTEIDAFCADLSGLDPDDFDWIVRDDPTDPKGFYRVDRQLPFRERLTGLAAAAFRALNEGKWSAESASELSNDEFFDLLGIPELTNAAATHGVEPRESHVPENATRDRVGVDAAGRHRSIR